jgi:hypothetical protein
MEKLNADEREHAMVFRIGTTTVQGISEGTQRWILGQVMDLNFFTWIFNFILVEHLFFWPITPIRSTPSFIFCTFCWVSYGDAKGGDVTTRQIHPWQLWDHGCQ